MQVNRILQRLGKEKLIEGGSLFCTSANQGRQADSEIATILGISPETVHQYVKNARANYDAVSPSQLVAHALFSGTISFMDIFKR